MLTVKTYQCGCGEDIYEDDHYCVNCLAPVHPHKFKEQEVAEIISETGVELVDAGSIGKPTINR